MTEQADKSITPDAMLTQSLPLGEACDHPSAPGSQHASANGSNAEAWHPSGAPAVEAIARCVYPHQTAALAFLRGDFVKDFAGELTALLRGAWHLRLAGAMLMRMAEFQASVEEGTCCYALAAAGTAGNGESPWLAMIEITPSIAFPIINCLLGGSSDDMFIPRRPLTAIERRLLARIVERACASLVRSWPGDDAPKLTAIPHVGTRNTETGTRNAESGKRNAPPQSDVRTPSSEFQVPDSRMLLAVSFELGLDRQAGTMRIALAIDLLPPLASPLRPATAAPAGASPLEVTAALDETTIAADDLARLAPGDILAIDTPIDGEVIIRVAGIPKFVGRLGICNGHRAVTITRRIN